MEQPAYNYQNSSSNYIEASSFDFSSQYSEVVEIDDSDADELLPVADINLKNKSSEEEEEEEEVHPPHSLEDDDEKIKNAAILMWCKNNNINPDDIKSVRSLSQHDGSQYGGGCHDNDACSVATSSIPPTSASGDLDFHTAEFSNDQSPKISPTPLEPTASWTSQPSKVVEQYPLEHKGSKVFITYCDVNDSTSHVTKKQLQSIYKFLLNNGVRASVDFMHDLLRSMSNAQWLEDEIQECDFIMVCINSDYMSVVEERLPSNVQQRKRRHIDQCTYVYRQIHQEYISNRAKNYRFIPLLIGDGNYSHVPRWLKDTRVYKWPDDFEDLMYRIYKVQKYRTPQLGQPPKCTITRYVN